jgi:hypothetical protein
VSPITLPKPSQVASVFEYSKDGIAKKHEGRTNADKSKEMSQQFDLRAVNKIGESGFYKCDEQHANGPHHLVRKPHHKQQGSSRRYRYWGSARDTGTDLAINPSCHVRNVQT